MNLVASTQRTEILLHQALLRLILNTSEIFFISLWTTIVKFSTVKPSTWHTCIQSLFSWSYSHHPAVTRISISKNGYGGGRGRKRRRRERKKTCWYFLEVTHTSEINCVNCHKGNDTHGWASKVEAWAFTAEFLVQLDRRAQSSKDLSYKCHCSSKVGFAVTKQWRQSLVYMPKLKQGKHLSFYSM